MVRLPEDIGGGCSQTFLCQDNIFDLTQMILKTPNRSSPEFGERLAIR